MTPFELALSHKLDLDRREFANGWLFQWHNINIPDRTVDVDDFGGKRIYAGGVMFEGQVQKIYWSAVERYLLAKIHEKFAAWDLETSAYGDARANALSGTENLLAAFCCWIIAQARDTDRRLRGRGFPERLKPVDVGQISEKTQRLIANLASAHRLLIDGAKIEKEGFFKRLISRTERFGTQYRGAIAIFGLVLAVVFGVLKLYRG